MTGTPYQHRKRQLYTAHAPHYDAGLEAVVGAEALALRNAWVAEVIESGQRVLDLGCGTGAVLTAMADAVGPSGLAVGADLTPAMLDLARARARGRSQVHLVELDATDLLPFASESFDCVCAIALLQEVAAPRSLLEEIRRIIRAGGVFRGIATTYRTLCPAAEVHMAAVEQLPMFIRPLNTVATMFMQIFGPAAATRWLPLPGLSDPELLGRLIGQPFGPVISEIRAAGHDPATVELGVLYMTGRRVG